MSQSVILPALPVRTTAGRSLATRILAALALISPSIPAEAQERKPAPRMAPPVVHAITPALGTYTDEVLFGEVWKRPQLGLRDRSMVTVAALIAGGHTAQMTGHFNRALDNGVKPSEIAAIITHLAFYSGWPNAMSAVTVANEVFTKRNLKPEEIAPPAGAPLALEAESEARRASAVQAAVGETAPELVHFTNDVLFGDLWRRADLTPRDRSLVTMVALIAQGQPEQLTFHLTRAMDAGMTKEQASEIITHLAFYAGWPRAMSAVPVAKAVFEARAAKAAPASTPAAAPAAASAVEVSILRKGAAPAVPGPASNFTGAVEVEQRFQRGAPARIGGGLVRFSAGARTNWHTHPLGQTLIMASGCGYVQRVGGAVEIMRAGDIVWIAPGVKHWHGATADAPMSHYALAEAQDGSAVAWMEPVTDAQYAGGPKGC